MRLICNTCHVSSCISNEKREASARVYTAGVEHSDFVGLDRIRLEQVRDTV